MAIPVPKIILGIDASKDSLETYEWHSAERCHLPNEAVPIRAWLKSLVGKVRIAIEPTSTYHRALVDEAHALGYAVYLVNARALKHYRTAVGERNKTDVTDAYLLARYLEREGAQLRPHSPRGQRERQLWALIKRRGVVVKLQMTMRQSLGGIRLSCKGATRELQRLIARIDARILQLIGELGWQHQYRLCKTLPGIGPVNAAALVAAFHRGAFAGADAFIAYLGLDVRIRQSGRYVGQRKLTKEGEAELRRLLWCAAQASRSYPPFDAYYHEQLTKGLPKTAAKTILGRKLARIAFALMRDLKPFQRLPQEA